MGERDLRRPGRGDVLIDERGVAEIELVDQGVQVPGEGVVLVTGPGPAGMAKAAAVVGDHAVTGPDERADLLFPGTTAQRPAVDQHDRPPGAVILIVEVHRR